MAIFFKIRYLQFCNVTSVLILAILSTLGIIRPNVASNPDDRIFIIPGPEQKWCTSQICEETGNEISNSIDKSADPCIDFYKHVCGRWAENHPIPENLNATYNKFAYSTKFHAQLKEMLENNDTPDSETLRKLRDYYRSCINLASIDAKGLSPLKSIVDANGGLPLALPSNNWRLKDKKLTLQKIYENYAKVVVSSPLFSFKVLPDPMNSSVNLLHLQPPENIMYQFLSKTKERNDEAADYMEYSEEVATEFARLQGFNVPSTDIRHDLEGIKQFETRLLVYLEGGSPTVMTIAQLQNTWNTVVSGHPEYAINWLKMIGSTLNGTDIVIDAMEKIVLTGPYNVKVLANILIQTSLRTVVNYVHWHVIFSLLPYTNKDMGRITNGLPNNSAEWKRNNDQRSTSCIHEHKMRDGLSYVWLQKYFQENMLLKAGIPDMISSIQEEYKRQFDQSSWIDDGAKLRAKQKVDNLMQYIGYPSRYNEPGKMDEYYSALKVGHDYFENAMHYNRFITMKELKKLRQPHERNDEWPLLHTKMEIHYDLDQNSLNFPVAAFQIPLYDDGRPLAVNYGSMGQVIGHEIGHAFDPKGIQTDEVGRKTKWMSNSTIDKYNEKADCFVNQYDKYPLVENDPYEAVNIYLKKHVGEDFERVLRNNTDGKAMLYVDGEQTLNENMADNMGFAIAVKAYRSYIKEHDIVDTIIPALREYTNMQILFYSLGNIWCESSTPLAAIENRRVNEHSPAPVRLNTVLSNMREFSKAFNCDSGTPMNPVNKCVFWD